MVWTLYLPKKSLVVVSGPAGYMHGPAGYMVVAYSILVSAPDPLGLMEFDWVGVGPRGYGD